MRTLSPMIALLLLIAPASACTVGLAEASVAPTGCAQEAIKISDAHNPFLGQGAPAHWTASCGGLRYYCIQTRDRTICSEDKRQPAQTAWRVPAAVPPQHCPAPTAMRR